MKRFTIIFCVVSACAAVVADTAADAVMFRKKPVEKPSRSFLDDIVTVKEVKETKPVAAPKPAAAAPEQVRVRPLETPQTGRAAGGGDVPSRRVKDAPPRQTSDAPVAEAPKPTLTVEKAAEGAPAEKEQKVEAVKAKAAAGDKEKAKKEKKPARDAIITADRTDYDRKEGVVLFDRNVYVDDEQYQMHADRLFLFLDGTNDLKRLVAIGHVAITNEDKRAYCARATFNKKLGRVVMYSSDEITAQLHEEGKKGSDVKGEKITFWLDSEQVEVENPVITMPGGLGGQDSMKKLIGK